MATFEANPNDENEPWIERAAIDGLKFRIWHFMFFAFCAFTCFMVIICCCVKIRVPRTKQEIEADYHRKKLAEKFRKRLKLIKNQDMDAIDLQKALQIIQQDYQNENQNYCYPGASSSLIQTKDETASHKSDRASTAEENLPHTSSFIRKAANIMNMQHGFVPIKQV